MALDLKRRRFTVDEYEQMGRAGILGEDDCVELIEGEIVEMTPIGRQHAACVDRLNYQLGQTLRGNALIRVQGPIRLGEKSEPQPDLALLRWKPDFYASGLPTSQDILLVVEVAETSVEADRRVKVPLYARSGISEVWLVDVEQETITTYTNPGPDGYRGARVARRGEQLSPSAFPDCPLAVADLLPE